MDDGKEGIVPLPVGQSMFPRFMARQDSYPVLQWMRKQPDITTTRRFTMRKQSNSNTAESEVSRLSGMTMEARFHLWLETHDIEKWLPFVEKNDKVYAYIFDLHPIRTCPNCEDCKRTCYAVKFEKMRANVLMRRTINTYLAENNIPLLEKLICRQLETAKRDIVRLHSAGDFFSQAYLDMWTRIIARFPHIRFYTYTKSSWMFDEIKSLPNFNLVASICPDGSINYGKLEDMQEKRRQFHAPICPYRKGQPNNPHCGLECKICLSAPLVLFVQH